ncbi:MAG: hypothetical protein LBM73_01695 [Candidatus Nomurabacteria bacterium]|jgi:hypothetical protein|nr:hypothetical protein [Candidatus Nomurabacteria bacterium]
MKCEVSVIEYFDSVGSAPKQPSRAQRFGGVVAGLALVAGGIVVVAANDGVFDSDPAAAANTVATAAQYPVSSIANCQNLEEEARAGKITGSGSCSYGEASAAAAASAEASVTYKGIDVVTYISDEGVKKSWLKRVVGKKYHYNLTSGQAFNKHNRKSLHRNGVTVTLKPGSKVTDEYRRAGDGKIVYFTKTSTKKHPIKMVWKNGKWREKVCNNRITKAKGEPDVKKVKVVKSVSSVTLNAEATATATATVNTYSAAWCDGNVVDKASSQTVSSTYTAQRRGRYSSNSSLRRELNSLKQRAGFSARYNVSTTAAQQAAAQANSGVGVSVSCSAPNTPPTPTPTPSTTLSPKNPNQQTVPPLVGGTDTPPAVDGGGVTVAMDYTRPADWEMWAGLTKAGLNVRQPAAPGKPMEEI